MTPVQQELQRALAASAEQQRKSENPMIEAQRQKIDELDKQLVDLITQRALAALAIGRAKEQEALTGFSPDRERRVLEAIKGMNKGPLTDEAIDAIFSEVIGACRAVQTPLKVAYLGPETTFSHQAAIRRFGTASQFVGQRSIIDVFDEVERGQCAVGVVPVENSSEGQVSVTLDKFNESSLKVCGEIYTPISHQLMSRERDLDRIETVFSHPQALNQCRGWLARNLPQARLLETSSTAAAAKEAARTPKSAAVGSKLAGRYYEMNTLAADIQDNAHNMTRFLVIGRQDCPPSGSDKTSVCFVCKHEPGTLFDALRTLADRKLNMTRIESRPNKEKPWEYIFYVDLEGHITDAPLREAFEEMAHRLTYLKVLGSYPKAEPFRGLDK